MAELCDVQHLSEANDGYKYLLTVIDCFSRKAFAVPLKNKSGGEVKRALEKVFLEGVRFQTDKGLEFRNRQVLGLLKKHGIKYFNSENPEIKCSLVERFNSTLKTRMYKYFTYKNTHRYIDILDDLLSAYNKRSIAR